jgi:hypothetical protein
VTTISICRLPHVEQTSRSRPIEHARFGAAPSSHIGGIGLDLMLAMLYTTQ